MADPLSLGIQAAATVGGSLLGGKDDGGTSQTSSVQPFTPAVPHLNSILDGAQQLFNADPTGANIVAPFSADQTAGFDATRGAAGAVGPFLGQAQDTIGGIMSGGANPWQEAVIERALGQSQLMANQQARAMGRQGSPAAMQNATELGISAIAPIAMQGHEAHIGNLMSAAGLAPALAQSQFMPGQQLLGIGGIQQGQAQAQLDAPFTALDRYSSQVLPISGLGRTGTTTTPGQGGGLQGAIGGALQGLQFAGGLGGGGGGFASMLGINPFGSF